MKLRNRFFVMGLALMVGLLALPLGVAEDTNVEVGNSAPTVVSVTLPSTVNPTAGSTTSVSTTIVVSDLNGYNDIDGVTVQVLKPDGSTTHVASAAATFDSGATTQATYTYSFDMNFYDAAALSTDTYKVKVTVTDLAGATGNNIGDLAVFNYAELAALSLGGGSISFGSDLSPGDTSSVQGLAVTNTGNVVLDTQLSGTDFTNASSGATIGVGNIAYSTASDMTGSAALSSTATTFTSFDLATGASSSSTIYWQLTVPSGSDQWVPSGAYAGDLTVAATKG